MLVHEPCIQDRIARIKLGNAFTHIRIPDSWKALLLNRHVALTDGFCQGAQQQCERPLMPSLTGGVQHFEPVARTRFALGPCRADQRNIRLEGTHQTIHVYLDVGDCTWLNVVAVRQRSVPTVARRP